jgi:hydroxymethylglutaryl-CoA reductase (NADPH)
MNTISSELVAFKDKYKSMKLYNLENELPNLEEAVKIRRKIIESKLSNNPGKKYTFKNLPFKGFSYKDVHGRCCENVIGYIPIPVGIAGPILINDIEYFLPMATTEGTLVASTSRGCKAILESGGSNSYIIRDSITRTPVIKCPNMLEAISIKKFCESNFMEIEKIFNSTSRFAKLQKIVPTITGRYIFLRFHCISGDAMGMNMIGKGTEKSIQIILSHFTESILKSLSGNMCVDKKASALNWIEGRGKSVICESIIKEDVVRNVLKTTVEKMIEINYVKNMIGSSMAATVGGNNAHASNIISAIFLACGQDIAQNVESSHCMTLMEFSDHNKKDLYVSVTLPCLEVGTVGGGTHLPAQSTMLDLLGVKGAHLLEPGLNSKLLAQIISGGVLAGELSLLAALSNNHLMKAHMLLNR